MKSHRLFKTLVSCVLCNTLMWYDYALFGTLIEVISNTFFPQNASQSLKLFATFATFASGFFMRPIGAAMFGHIGDKFGRKQALFLSMISMSIPIIMISLLPGYKTWGIASTVLFILTRMFQGFSLGGEAGNAAYMVEHSMHNKRSTFFSSFEVVSAVFGSILAFTVSYILKQIFGATEFATYGWRFAFGAGFVMGLISLILRHRSDETPTYEKAKENDEIKEKPLSELIKNYKLQLAIAIGIDGVENSAFYICLVFLSVFVEQISSHTIQIQTSISILSSSFLAVMTLFFAFIADRFGAKNILLLGSVMFLFLSIPIFMLLDSGNYTYVIFAQMLFIIPFSASLGPVNTVMSDLFPTEVRYTGFSIARNISSAIFGGMAPILAMAFIKVTGVKSMAGLYMMLVATIGIVSVFACNSLKKKQKYDNKQITKQDNGYPLTSPNSD